MRRARIVIVAALTASGCALDRLPQDAFACGFGGPCDRGPIDGGADAGAPDAANRDAGVTNGAPPQAIAAGFVNLVFTTDHGWDIAADGPHQRSFQHGYLEAILRFDPTRGPSSDGWPAFWSLSTEHANNQDSVDGMGGAEKHFAGLDFFEAYTGGHAAFSGTTYATWVHDWTGIFNVTCSGGYCDTKNSDAYHVPMGTSWSVPHKYGCLWVPGNVTWFFDDVRGPSVSWTPGATYSILDQNHMIPTLSTGSNWPLEVTSVKIWQ